MPLKQYVIKRRFELASWYLIYTDLKINEIVTILGYSDTSSFSRSFKKRINCSPNQFRKTHGLKLSDLSEGTLESLPPYEIKTIPVRSTVVFPTYGNYYTTELYKVWQDVFDYFEKENLDYRDYEFCGQYYDCYLKSDETNLLYEATIVCKKDDQVNDKNFFKGEIEGGKFICFKVQGHVIECESMVKTIFKKLFHINGFELRRAPPVFRYDHLNCGTKDGYVSGELQIPCSINR